MKNSRSLKNRMFDRMLEIGLALLALGAVACAIDTGALTARTVVVIGGSR
jgi:hypothetical protein